MAAESMLALHTERLRFRQWETSDFEAFSNFFSDPENAKFVGGQKSPEEAWRLMCAYIGQYQLKGYSYVAVEHVETEKLVGTVGLWDSDPWPEVELGYWLLPDMQGKGFAIEAAQAVLSFAFQQSKLKTLVSYIDETNVPSIRLAERLGGVHDGGIDLLEYGYHAVYRYQPVS